MGDRERFTDRTKRKLTISLAISIVLLVFTIICIIMVFVIGSLAGLIAFMSGLLSLVGFAIAYTYWSNIRTLNKIASPEMLLAHWKYQHSPSCEAYISRLGVFYDGELHSFRSAGERLVKAEWDERQQGSIALTYSHLGNPLISLSIPIPAGEQERAAWVLSEMQKEVYEQAVSNKGCILVVAAFIAIIIFIIIVLKVFL